MHQHSHIQVAGSVPSIKGIVRIFHAGKEKPPTKYADGFKERLLNT
jgi:hypothetical protein